MATAAAATKAHQMSGGASCALSTNARVSRASTGKAMAA